MTELENIGKLAATASELLNAIRGGEIANMKAEHVQVLQDFETAYNKAISDFATEKTQKLSEFNNQKTSALNDLANRADAVIANVEAHLSASIDRQTHIRLTKNQALHSNPEGNFPLNWANGTVIRAELVETVATGVEPEQRSALAQEFLSAINSNQKYFNRAFNIWEIEVAPATGDKTTTHLPWQNIAISQTYTVAAIVKHISGSVPWGNYCTGLEAGEPAKLCGQVRSVSSNRNSYVNTHPYVGRASENTVVQIALPAAVTGQVDLSKAAWGQFPYIGDTLTD